MIVICTRELWERHLRFDNDMSLKEKGSAQMKMRMEINEANFLVSDNLEHYSKAELTVKSLRHCQTK
ncbi:CLUMA_CG017335, isoform A [Clunio marinus]|uniref:CLUMA_CG017335, isoform A n=1 Tax=Clunio marinus TaxID=568069 RepID=A0A1J1IVV2_9DIPT|nr:CLUMA_CG017335, isoform A [Clunio marinus]